MRGAQGGGEIQASIRPCRSAAIALLMAFTTLPSWAGTADGNRASVCFDRPATIVGTAHKDTLIGTRGRDVIVSRGGADSIAGRGGADRICGGQGIDVISGGRGDDRISGGSEADLVVGDGFALYSARGRGDDLLSAGTETTQSSATAIRFERQHAAVGTIASSGALDRMISWSETRSVPKEARGETEVPIA